MVKRVLIAFDFDHTLVDESVDTYVLKLLPDGGRLPPSVQKLHSIHEWNVYQREVLRYLHKSHVTKDQLLACVAEMPLVKGIRELLEYLVTFKMTPAKADAKTSESDASVSDVSRTQVAENGYCALRQQQPVINGGGTLPLGPTRSAVSSSAAAGLHSIADGKINSPVQFEIIIISDANLVSTRAVFVSYHLMHFLVTLFELASKLLKVLPNIVIFIRLKARLLRNIGFTVRRTMAVFTHSAITPPKVNQFG